MTLGWRIDELEGKKFLDLVHPDDLAVTMKAMGDLQTGKGIVNFVNRFRCKDGVYRWIEWRSFPYGEKLMYAAARDITERKQVEQALQLANKKLNLMAEITRHDIRNKLTVLGGYLSPEGISSQITGIHVCRQADGDNDHNCPAYRVYPHVPEPGGHSTLVAECADGISPCMHPCGSAKGLDPVGCGEYRDLCGSPAGTGFL